MISTIEGTMGYKQNIEAVSFMVYENYFVVSFFLLRSTPIHSLPTSKVALKLIS